ncbi:RICIN domain-containing protein [Streptosporangium sp. V21-05]|uniref:RICIN domain-containing protein n=1 Tax=Streptosporangium sp. V21-05 TaxID=3446115 RepID=UPI003F535EDB
MDSRSTPTRRRGRFTTRLVGPPVVVALVAATALVAVAFPSRAAVVPVADGVYTLASGSSGKCVDVAAASVDNGALLVQVACNGGAADQQWRAVAQSGGLTSPACSGPSTTCRGPPRRRRRRRPVAGSWRRSIAV